MLRQYKLPDEYRLTQYSLNGFYKAVNESNPAKRLRMLRARNVERNFQMYPPYWYYRAKSAIESKDDDEAARCYDKFAEVWRPVLRNDPYRLEEVKYRVQKLALNAEKNRDEIRKWLEVIQDCISAGDWSNNLFAGIAYFLLGDKDEGIACVEVNVDFEYEKEISVAVLVQMKKGKLDVSALHGELRRLYENIENKKEVASEEDSKTEPDTKLLETSKSEEKATVAGDDSEKSSSWLSIILGWIAAIFAVVISSALGAGIGDAIAKDTGSLIGTCVGLYIGYKIAVMIYNLIV